MARYNAQDEKVTRMKLEEVIETEAMQTDKITFFPPSYVVSILEDYGYNVTKATVISYYTIHGVKYENGLWVRKIK